MGTAGLRLSALLLSARGHPMLSRVCLGCTASRLPTGTLQLQHYAEMQLRGQQHLGEVRVVSGRSKRKLSVVSHRETTSGGHVNKRRHRTTNAGSGVMQLRTRPGEAQAVAVQTAEEELKFHEMSRELEYTRDQLAGVRLPCMLYCNPFVLIYAKPTHGTHTGHAAKKYTADRAAYEMKLFGTEAGAE